MIDRYSREEIKKIWDLKVKFDYFLKVEVAVCQAYARLGYIPMDAVRQIKEKASFSVARIDEIEKITRHDVIAFIENVNENTYIMPAIILLKLEN